MKALTLFSIACVCLVSSCAYLGMMTLVETSRTLPKTQWGEFENLRQFVTLQPLAMYPSTKGLVPVGERQSPGPDGKLEYREIIPKGSVITVTRIVLYNSYDYNNRPKRSRIIYGTLEMDGVTLRDVSLSVIANFDDEPSYDRQIVSPL
jgi:hypothetical protein